MQTDRVRVPETVLEAVAAENCCDPSQLTDGGTHIVELRPERADNPARRRFPISDPSLSIVTMGTGGVVAASSEWLPWTRELFDGAHRDSLFDVERLGEVARRVEPSGARLWGPLPKFVGTQTDIAEVAPPEGYEVALTGPEGVEGLDPAPWPHALPSRPLSHHVIEAAALARLGNELVGVATAMAHNDMLWSIGIQIAPEHRGHGIGVALTARLGAAILDRGRVPYYGTSSSNVPSMRTALAAGFRPAWVDVYTTRQDRLPDGAQPRLGSGA